MKRAIFLLWSLMLVFSLAACGGDDDSVDTTDGDQESEAMDGDMEEDGNENPLPDGDYQPDGDTPDGDIPDGDTPDGDTPDGDTPDGDTPDGDTPDGDTPDGDTPDGDMPDGDMPDGDMPDGDTPDGDTPDGDTPDGDTPDGDTPDGDTPDGDTPDGDTPDGDTPDGDTPDGDMPDGDTPDGDTPDGDTPDGDTPDGDTPDGDTPDGDTPDGDMPDGDMPDGDDDVVDGDQTYPVCVPNSRTCYGLSIFICNSYGTGYLAPETCNNQQYCSDGTCHARVCDSNSAICADDFSYQSCLSDGSGFGDPVSCGDDRYCQFGVCFDQICTPDQASCNDSGQVVTCNALGSGYVDPVDCNNDQYCDNGTCLNQVCVPDSWVCDGNDARRHCLSNGSGYGDPVLCGNNEYCEGGTCQAQVCEPGVAECDDNDDVITCNDLGSGYGDPVACGQEQICSNGVCLDSVCDPGESVCSGNDVLTCLNTGLGYGTPVACGQQQYCESGTCYDQVCTPNERECNESDAVIVCNNNGSAWGEPQNCGAEQYCDAGYCYNQICPPLESECDGEDAYLVCNDQGSGYGDPISCGIEQVCIDGGCVDQICTPGVSECEGNATITCNDTGTGYSVASPCGNDQYCDGGVCRQQICTPNEAECSDDSVIVCNENGSGYGDPVACGQDQYCDGGACYDQVCTPNQSGCDGNDVVLCNATGSGYSQQVPCGQDQYCEGGVCHQQDCTPNAVQCSGNAVITCNENGSGWSDPVGCGDGYYCETGVCYEQICTPNETTCDGNFHYHTCTSNGSAYGTSYSCGTDRYCNGGDCYDQVCTPGEGQCLTATSYRECNESGSAWNPDQYCSGDYLCDDGACYDPSDLPDPSIEVAFIRPQPGETREMTQSESVTILVNATMQGGSITSVDLMLDDELFGTDPDLPYEFPFTVPVDAPTDHVYTLVAVAHGNNGRHNDSAESYINIRNDPPEAVFTATVAGDLVLAVDGSGSNDRETAMEDLEVRWDWENDGVFDTDWSTEKVATYDGYTEYGSYTIGMEVRDAVDQVDFTTREVSFSDLMYIGGTIDADTTWYGTVIITGTVTISNNATVIVAEGTQVLFVYQDTQPANGVGDYSIVVNSGSSFVVNGTESNPVLISSYGSDHRHSKAWGSIVLNGGSSSVSHAIIEYGNGCLDIRDATPLTAVEVRYCGTYGVKLSTSNANGNLFQDVSIHDDDELGLYITSSAAAYDISGLALYNNGTHGATISSSGAGTIDDCDVYDNAHHGFSITAAQPALTNCVIQNNGQTGASYSTSQGGSMEHCLVTNNSAEGIRVETTSSSPRIQWNNIYGNSVTGGWTVGSENTSSVLTWSGDACTGGCNTYKMSSVWSPPGGGLVKRMKVSFWDQDCPETYDWCTTNYISGGIAGNGSSSQILWSRTSDITNTWVDLSSSSPESVAVYVYDTGWGSDNNGITASEVVYTIPDQSGIEMSVNTLSTTVDARFNYWGVFPNVLDAVGMNSHSAVNLQGFVGVPFDEEWDNGPYVGGVTISEDDTLSGDVYITGDITIASGTTITMDPGTQVHFVKHDQDGSGVGDFSVTVSGVLDVMGTEGNPVIIDGYGQSPEEDSFEEIRLYGQGSSWDYVEIAHGLRNLVVQSEAASLSHLTVSEAGTKGVQFISTASGASLSYSTVENCGTNGIEISGGTVELSYVTSNHNAVHGLSISGSSANVTATDSTFRYNDESGFKVLGASTSLTMSYCHLGDNGRFGAELAGSVSGSLTYSNISFNQLPGFSIWKNSSGMPSVAINQNNIFSNSVTQSYEVGGADTSATLTWTGDACTGGCNVYRMSDLYTAPDGGNIQYVKVSFHDEDCPEQYSWCTTNYITGGVAGNGSSSQILWSRTTDVTNYWVDISSTAPESIAVYVYDTGWGSDNNSITGSTTIFGGYYTNDIGLTAMTTGSESLNAQANYWGSLDVAPKISEYPSGLVDYSSFTGAAYTVGPR